MKAEQGKRLRQARIEAGYETAADAARAMGVRAAGYNHHENGTAGLSRAGERYARFFRVALDWLLTGKGAMRPLQTAPDAVIAIDGAVRAGSQIDPMLDPQQDKGEQTMVRVPAGDDVGGYIVRGGSQWPRFLDGEIILYDKRPRTPRELLAAYAVVQTLDGRRVIKIIRANPNGGADLWRLESHNAEPENDVRILAAWRYLGVLPRQETETLPPLKTAKPRAAPRKKR